jgi:beta-catenin-like protein 1
LDPSAQLSTATASAEEILNALNEENEEPEVEELDEAAVKRLSNQLEKKVAKNRELRIKYADEPQRFLESEADLNNSIQDMHAVAAQLELYPVLVKLGTVQLFLQLLGHENMDIVAVTCNLLQELTDLDSMYENEDFAKDLIDELMNSRIIETIVQQGLKRLNEEDKDEADAVANALSVIENVSLKI